jgi:hypothetical protein
VFQIKSKSANDLDVIWFETQNPIHCSFFVNNNLFIYFYKRNFALNAMVYLL